MFRWLEFEEFWFLENYGVEPNSYDQDNFIYEYKFECKNDPSIHCLISFGIHDRIFFYDLFHNDHSIVAFRENNLQKIDCRKDEIVFQFEERTIKFNVHNFEFASETSFYR